MAQLPKHVLPKALLINNAVSRQFIDAVDAYIRTDNFASLSGFPVLGYYGAIAEWFDFDLIEHLAEEFPESRIVLIGPISGNISKRVASILWRHSNVVVLPACKQLELIPFLKRFDVCMIPFVKNAVTDAVSPVKLFEYFSAGKPVVTTNLDECAKYTPVYIAKDNNQFINLVRDLLVNESKQIDKAAHHVALMNTWEDRVQLIITKMQAISPLP